jgi:hypothetical protein
MSTGKRMTGLGAVLLMGGALLAAAPAANATTQNLPAPTPPQLISAVASGNGTPGQSRVTITIKTTSFDTQREFFYVYANGYNLAVGDGGAGFPATTDSAGGQTMVSSSFPICAGVAAEPAIECQNQAVVNALKVGSTITVTAYGQNTGPNDGNPIVYTDESAPSNAMKVTVG